MVEPANPYESPTEESSDELHESRPVFPFMVKTCVLGCTIGAIMGIGACFVLSGGNAAWWFYPRWGGMGLIVGLVGGAISGFLIALLRGTVTNHA